MNPLFFAVFLIVPMFSEFGYASGQPQSTPELPMDQSEIPGMAGGAVNRIEESVTEVISNLALDREVHIWERYVRDFRTDHHFVFSLAIDKGTWGVEKFGTLSDESYESRGGNGKFQYSFHIPVYRGFGYFLGSTLGYHYEASSEDEDFFTEDSLHFPSVLVGLIYNFTPGFRFHLAADYYLERYDEIRENDKVSSREDGDIDDSIIGITMQTVDLVSGLDFFYTLNWAVRMEFHVRRSRYQAPKELDSQPLNAAISRRDMWVGLGVLYHLL